MTRICFERHKSGCSDSRNAKFETGGRKKEEELINENLFSLNVKCPFEDKINMLDIITRKKQLPTGRFTKEM